MLGELINKHALAHNLRPDIVACIIIQESNGNTFAFRFEPAFYDTYIKNKLRHELSGLVPNYLPNLTTEKIARATSWGLMQVMGESARSIGKYKNPYLTLLCNPEEGIDAGCRVLSYYLGRENGDLFRALVRYNAGNPKSELGERYANSILDRVDRKEHLRFFTGG